MRLTQPSGSRRGMGRYSANTHSQAPAHAGASSVPRIRCDAVSNVNFNASCALLVWQACGASGRTTPLVAQRSGYAARREPLGMSKSKP